MNISSSSSIMFTQLLENRPLSKLALVGEIDDFSADFFAPSEEAIPKG